MIKTNIKMIVTQEQSKKVQKIFFKNGIFWGLMKYASIDNLDKPFLFYKSGVLIELLHFHFTF